MQTNDYLLVTDVPSMVSMYHKVFTLHYSDSLAGNLHLTSNHGPNMSHEDPLSDVFSNYSCCLLAMGIDTVAALKNSERSFKIFDSHSKDLLGMPHSFRTLLYITFFTLKSGDMLITVNPMKVIKGNKSVLLKHQRKRKRD